MLPPIRISDVVKMVGTKMVFNHLVKKVTTNTQRKADQIKLSLTSPTKNIFNPSTSTVKKVVNRNIVNDSPIYKFWNND